MDNRQVSNDAECITDWARMRADTQTHTHTHTHTHQHSTWQQSCFCLVIFRPFNLIRAFLLKFDVTKHFYVVTLRAETVNGQPWPSPLRDCHITSKTILFIWSNHTCKHRNIFCDQSMDLSCTLNTQKQQQHPISSAQCVNYQRPHNKQSKLHKTASEWFLCE